MKVKVSELQGAALDWAVANCEGELSQHGGQVHLVESKVRFYEDTLDIQYTPSTDWAQGGPIIEREWLDITPWPNESDEDLRWQCKQHDSIDCVAFGPTPLIAAMRCYVASKFGDDLVLFKVEVPDELA
jgi:hypothetical protein